MTVVELNMPPVMRKRGQPKGAEMTAIMYTVQNQVIVIKYDKMTRNRAGDSKSNEDGKQCAKLGPVDFQDGDMRSAILEIMQMDEDIMNSAVKSVSQAIVTKFMNKLTQKVVQSGDLLSSATWEPEEHVTHDLIAE